MNLCRIQISRAVRALKLSLIWTGAMLMAGTTVSAQCGAGYTAQTSTFTQNYSSTTGNSQYTISVPQFNVAGATLYSVNIQSVVNLTVTEELQNTTGGSVNAQAFSFRNDDISSSNFPNAVYGGDYNNSMFSNFFVYNNMPAGAIKDFGPTKVINNVSNLNYTMNTSDGNLDQSSWAGAGNVNFTYTTSTSPLASPSGVQINSYSVSDQMNFSVTYYYCAPIILAINLVSFTAVRENDQTVQLAWNTENEEANRTYVIETSMDGVNFTDGAKVSSDPVNKNASYSYNYQLDPTASGKIYFRLRMIDNTGQISYSGIRIISLDGGAATTFAIYPNPATSFVNLILPGTTGTWQVDLIAADGSVVQRNAYSNTTLAKVGFSRKLARGTYFVRAVNQQSGENHTGSFVIAE